MNWLYIILKKCMVKTKLVILPIFFQESFYIQIQIDFINIYTLHRT